MHVNYKQLDYVPLPIWWIHLMVVSKLSRVATTIFNILQGHHVTVAMNWTRLVSMQTSLFHTADKDIPLSHL